MWVLLTKKLPTSPSPPKLSIFWSIPWPDGKYAPTQELAIRYARRYRDNLNLSYEEELLRTAQQSRIDLTGSHMTEQDSSFPDALWGLIPNYIGARQILYLGEPIRVFPHEFTEIPHDRLLEYIRESHVMVAEGVAQQMIQDALLDTDQKLLMDAALTEGADPTQATLLALGVDITIPDPEIPPIGWYRIKPEYGLIFSSARDLNMTEEEAAIYREVQQ